MLNKEELLLTGLMLRYPTKELVEELKEIDTENPYIQQILQFFRENDLLDIQQEYVKSFDLSDKSSLYLTYHRFRDDPKRGTYLARLVSYYREKGFEFVENELPDFLPVVLEFIYYQPEEIGMQILKEFEKELLQIQKGLEEVNSKYLPLINFITQTILREVNVR